jgi:hypothetical protein
MKKVVGNVVVVVLASLYLMAISLIHAARLAYEELDPYVEAVSLFQMAVLISALVVGFGMLGVLIAVIQ